MFLSWESAGGRDNPFRPGGDISREADHIVDLIRSGRPLLEEPPLEEEGSPEKEEEEVLCREDAKTEQCGCW